MSMQIGEIDLALKYSLPLPLPLPGAPTSDSDVTAGVAVAAMWDGRECKYNRVDLLQ